MVRLWCNKEDVCCITAYQSVSLSHLPFYRGYSSSGSLSWNNNCYLHILSFFLKWSIHFFLYVALIVVCIQVVLFSNESYSHFISIKSSKKQYIDFSVLLLASLTIDCVAQMLANHFVHLIIYAFNNWEVPTCYTQSCHCALCKYQHLHSHISKSGPQSTTRVAWLLLVNKSHETLLLVNFPVPSVRAHASVST